MCLIGKKEPVFKQLLNPQIQRKHYETFLANDPIIAHFKIITFRQVTIAFLWLVSHDNSEIKIAQLMAVTQPMQQLTQTLVHHLKGRNVKASIRP